MGIERTTPELILSQFLEAIPQILYSEIARALSYLGEQCIKNIRDRSGDESWFDRTGNLRSSIGYAVYAQGKKVMESAFNQIGQGIEGSTAGKKMINDLASIYSRTFALVVVAGMEYADYVEAMESKDVLASTELWAKGQIQEYLNNALMRAQNKIEQVKKQSGL